MCVTAHIQMSAAVMLFFVRQRFAQQFIQVMFTVT